MISHILAILADHCSHAKFWLRFWLIFRAPFFGFSIQKWLWLQVLADCCGCSNKVRNKTYHLQEELNKSGTDTHLDHCLNFVICTIEYLKKISFAVVHNGSKWLHNHVIGWIPEVLTGSCKFLMSGPLCIKIVFSI